MWRQLYHLCKQGLLLALLAIPVLLIHPELQADQITIDDSVEDTALRNRLYSGWNFGKGVFLEAGYMPGLYEIHHAVSLIRFHKLPDLSLAEMDSVKLRLYTPKDYIQYYPVTVSLYEVAPENAGWSEGASECATEKAASSWDFKSNGQPWFGAPGCQKEGADYHSPMLDQKQLSGDVGKGIEFEIPVKLVRKWVENPKENAGVYLVAERPKLGAHAFFYSSEHHSGDGPQLVIDYQSDDANVAMSTDSFSPNPQYVFPEAGDQFNKWLASSEGRYVEWVRDARMNQEQALQFYYFDVVVRGEFLLPKCRLLLSDIIIEMDSLIVQRDRTAIKKRLKDVRDLLLVWEYIRQTRWYDSGPLAETLTPYQLGKIWGEYIFGRLDDGRWAPKTPEELEQEITQTIAKKRRQLNLSSEAMEVIGPKLRKYETLEQKHIDSLKQALETAYPLLKTGNDGSEMWEAVRKLHYHHELFLYYMSNYSMPRWTMFMDYADPIALAKMFIDSRREEYNPGRMGRNLDHARRYARKPLEIENWKSLP